MTAARWEGNGEELLAVAGGESVQLVEELPDGPLTDGAFLASRVLHLNIDPYQAAASA